MTSCGAESRTDNELLFELRIHRASAVMSVLFVCTFRPPLTLAHQSRTTTASQPHASLRHLHLRARRLELAGSFGNTVRSPPTHRYTRITCVHTSDIAISCRTPVQAQRNLAHIVPLTPT
jgi:hypothetical protein